MRTNGTSLGRVQTLSLVKWIDLPVRGDDRGSLIAIELGETLPFEVQRFYYIFGTVPGVSRGFHAHRSLQQVIVCVSGQCRFVLDDGRIREDVVLDNPARGLLVGDFLWREMHDFSKDCVLMVFASDHYHESDYIRSYEAFLASVN